MKRHFFGIMAGVFLMSMSAQAGLWVTPIDNASFELINGGQHATSGWGYVIDDWHENEAGGNYATNFWESGADIGLAGDGDLWAGTETGGAFYQPVGTVDDNRTYSVSMLIGSRWGTSFNTASVSLYAGGAEGDGADGVDLPSIASLLDTISVTVLDGTPVATDVYAVTVDLSTGTGHGGDLLWLELRSVAGKDYFDAVSIVPEPCTIALLGLGSLALIRRRK